MPPQTPYPKSSNAWGWVAWGMPEWTSPPLPGVPSPHSRLGAPGTGPHMAHWGLHFVQGAITAPLQFCTPTPFAPLQMIHFLEFWQFCHQVSMSPNNHGALIWWWLFGVGVQTIQVACPCPFMQCSPTQVRWAGGGAQLLQHLLINDGEGIAPRAHPSDWPFERFQSEATKIQELNMEGGSAAATASSMQEQHQQQQGGRKKEQ